MAYSDPLPLTAHLTRFIFNPETVHKYWFSLKKEVPSDLQIDYLVRVS